MGNDNMDDGLKDQVIDALKSLQEEDFTVYNCIATFFTLTVIGVTVRYLFLRYLVPHTENSENKIDDFIVEVVKKWLEPMVIILASSFVAISLFPVDDALELMIRFAFMAVITWRIARFVEQAVIFFLESVVFKREEDQNLLVNFHKVLKMVLYSFVVVFVLDNCGFNITSIIASLGIGGIAIALAVQNILTDSFASFCLLVDKPFEHGDLIRVNGHLGVVDYIGFKTTHIRSLTGELVVFPNSALICSTLQNFKQAEYINTCFDIGIANETSDEDVKRLPEVVASVFERIERADYVLAFFKSFGDFALIYEIRYKVLSNSADVARAVLGEINTEINAEFKKQNINMPYPTSVRLSG
jgi:small-conductance mechanosensitive channel